MSVGLVRRMECAPYAAESRPIEATQRLTIRSYCRRLLGQLKLNRPLGLALQDHGALGDPRALSDVADPEADQITATQLAVDCEIEQGELAVPIAVECGWPRFP
jgi:uncharacterized protein (DUF2336 family)